ncbi:right-handed parallel beta-helix repeat-containing protein [Cytobacillus firmus]|uniref:right-handed parallel beta-helix repeat-containing protein n=1 Tax=Cytobacillus firmus TaxID=1399 RepID=UPI00202EE478|nr:right-handed parallel beta-helix repeat-containing protein [Cytobacillus firmus]URT70205.1 right-handed parallel beta-helix repeat-containing protein [Cytobacillus firmus]
MVKNGNISINGQEISVYDDSAIKAILEDTAKKTHTHLELHTHTNTVQLDKIGENTQGELTYNGSVVKGSLSNASIYMLELSRWGVKNNGTDAINTSKGINEAFIWAAGQNYSEVVLPKGTYLISKDEALRPQSFTTINLNGSTLKMETNGSSGYILIAIERGKEHIRITNGILEGDRDTHDYHTNPGTHEHGFGILIRYSNNNITIDNLDIHSMTGDAISVQCGTGYVGDPGSNHWSFLDNGGYVQGGINNDGTFNTNTNRIRSATKIDVTVPSMINNGRAFVFGGNDFGVIGDPVTASIIDVAFYASDNTFIQLKSTTFFERIPIPEGANYAYMSLRQSVVPPYTSLTVRWQDFPRNVHIDRCNLHHNRRLGVMLSGQDVHLKNCTIHDNGTINNGVAGTGPNSGLDIEDGGGLNQHIFIENNNFYNNLNWSLILVYGKHIRIKNNTFHDRPIVNMVGTSKIEIAGNTFISSGAFLYAETLFTNNILFNSQLIIGEPEWEDRTPRRVEVSGSYFHNSSLNFQNKQDYSSFVTDCAFFADESFMGTLVVIGEYPQTIRDCTIYGGEFSATTNVRNGWVIEGILFTNGKGAKLGNATYKRCTFINPGKIVVVTNPNAVVELDECHFEWSTSNLFESDFNIKLLKVKNCTFKGKDKPAFFIWQAARIEFINNIFEFDNTKTNSVIELFYSNTQNVVLTDNRFKASLPMDIIKQSNSAARIDLTDNFIDNMNVSNNGLICIDRNKINGVIGQATEPTFGYFKKGQLIPNSNPISGGFMGWITTTEGIANTYRLWTPNTYLFKGTIIYMNNHFFVSLTNEGSTGSTAPPWPTVLGETVIDKQITWKNIGVKAVFKTYGSIS